MVRKFVVYYSQKSGRRKPLYELLVNIIIYDIYQYFNIFVTFKADEIAAVPEIVAGDTRLIIS